MNKFIIPCILIASFGCETYHDKYDAKHNVSYEPKGELVYGTLDSSFYQNTYFGFSIQCPLDQWTILNVQQYNQRLADNKEYLSASDQIWEQSTANFNNLLTLEKKIDRRKPCSIHWFYCRRFGENSLHKLSH